MMFPLFGGIFFGSLVCAIFLNVQLFLKKRMRAWVIPFAVGWLFFVVGCTLMTIAQFTPQKNYSWQDGWGGGFLFVSLLLSWISAAIFCYFVYYKKYFAASTYEQQKIEMPLPPMRYRSSNHADE